MFRWMCSVRLLGWISVVDFIYRLQLDTMKECVQNGRLFGN